VGIGEIDDAVTNVKIEYERILPIARTVYTPEIIEKARERRNADADLTKRMPPEYLTGLHNRMVLFTA